MQMEKDIMNLLDTQNQVMVNILDLISDNNRWYTVNEISMELMVVERTVQRYIHRLQELVNDYNEEKHHLVVIHYEKYKGVRLEIDSGSNYMELKSYILENDETMQIFKLIIFEEFESISKYAADNYVSESSIRKSLKKIKQFLSNYQLSLSRSSFRIEGEEKQIRLIIYITTWIIFKGVTWPFDFISQRKIYASVDRFSEELDLGFSVIHQKQMAYMLAVNILRLRKKHVITMEDEWRQYVNLPKLIEKIPMLNVFISDYNIYIESELYFYVVLLQLKPKFFESENYRNSVFNYHQKMSSNIYKSTELFMDTFNKKIDVIPEELETRFFVTSFCTHLFSQLFSNIQVDIDGHMIFRNLEDDYPNLNNHLEELVEELHEVSGEVLFTKKSFLLQKYMMLFSSVLPLTYYESEIKLYLDTDLPFFVKTNVTNQITDRFKYDFNLRFITSNEMEEADLVLTNIPNLLEEELRFSKQVHLFDFPFNHRDFIEIERKMKAIVHEMR